MAAVASTPTSPSAIGARVRKLDGEVLLTGRARFVDDYDPPGTLHAAILRSEVPHGLIRAIDTDGAAAAPGVALVLTGEQAAAHAGPIPYFIDPVVRGGVRADVHCLARHKVVYAGQPVVAVVAATRNDAEAALASVKVTYEPLPHVLDPDRALADDAPRLYDDWDDNVVLHNRYGEGDVDGALAAAHGVLSGTLRIQRYTTAPIEPRGYVATWDDHDEILSVHASCQNPQAMRWMLADSLGLAQNQIRVITAQVGGSFGLKMQGHPEEVLVALLSLLSKAPVKWIEDRRETFLAGGREQIHRFTVGFEENGRILALRDRIVANLGALSPQAGWAMPNLSAMTLPSGYDVRHVDVGLHAVVTNKAPLAASRGFGKEAAHLVIERVVDLVAREVGVDPADIRRRNFVRSDAFPYRTATGLNIDSGDYEALLDKALETIDYTAQRRRQHQLRDAGRHLGIGLAFEVTPESADGPGTLVGGFDVSTVRMSSSGDVTVLSGVTAPGGGNETGIAQVVAAELGMPIDAIRVVQGDTARCPDGFGNYSGRSLLVGGGSAALAARDLRAKLETVGARMLGVTIEDVEVHDGYVRVRDGDRGLAVADVAHTIVTRAFAVADEVEPTLESTRAYKPDNIDHVPDERGRIQPYPTYSSCMHVAVVEVDVETGVVRLVDFATAHDCGIMVNPALVEGQAHGAVVMGVGGALMEELIYGADGRLVTDHFKTYLLPRAGDLPTMRIAHQVTPSPFTLLGTKGAGEAGVGGGQAAVANAVEDALQPFAVTVDRLPLTPMAVLQMLDGQAET